jgi:small-conductance mechanosensitive channel
MGLLETTFLGNTLQSWLIALGVFLLAYVVFSLARRALLRRLRQPPAKPGLLNESLLVLLQKTRPWLVLILAFYLGSLALDLPAPVEDFLGSAAVVALIIQATFLIMALIDLTIQRRIRLDKEGAAETATSMNALKLVANIALWAVASLLILENVTGMDMNALIAALGIGGIAVALAVQNILGDLFSSVSIATDKPFVIGDAIAIDDFQGTVESIGLKSTRVRSVTGEQVIFSNSDLLQSRIRNIQRMQRRRASFVLNLDYQTPTEKLAAIPAMLREIVEAHENVTFDRAHFRSFGSSALTFDCAYFVETPNLTYFLDTQQAINLAIHQRFAEEGIPFATITPPPAPGALSGRSN